MLKGYWKPAYGGWLIISQNPECSQNLKCHQYQSTRLRSLSIMITLTKTSNEIIVALISYPNTLTMRSCKISLSEHQNYHQFGNKNSNQTIHYFIHRWQSTMNNAIGNSWQEHLFFFFRFKVYYKTPRLMGILTCI